MGTIQVLATIQNERSAVNSVGNSCCREKLKCLILSSFPLKPSQGDLDCSDKKLIGEARTGSAYDLSIIGTSQGDSPAFAVQNLIRRARVLIACWIWRESGHHVSRLRNRKSLPHEIFGRRTL